METVRHAEDRPPQVAAAWLCDQAGQVLELAGWGAAAQRATAVRDALLAGDDLRRCEADLSLLTAGVTRSRLLRWSLRDLAAPGGAGPAGDPGDAAGGQPRGRPDVLGRLVGLLRAAGDLVAGRPPGSWGTTTDLDGLPSMVLGLDLAAARLVVAAAAPDTARVGPPAEVSHG